MAQVSLAKREWWLVPMKRFIVLLMLSPFMMNVALAQSEPAPYEKDMLRLSEILGALHHLRPLCGAQDEGAWRRQMQLLMDSEGGPVERRERLAGAFNTGFEAFQRTYRTCTASADIAMRRFLAEGSRLSHDIAVRYGN
jgi:uncharacterized protein (TIGR02301 family)